MMDFTRYVATRLRALVTRQSDPIPGTAQVPNSAGGFAWALDRWSRLDRFLVLGTEGGTYYVGERELTVDNARAVAECIAEDGPRVVRRIVEVSAAGRAPRNDPALFALAMAAGTGDAVTRAVALEALPRVARTGTHLFHFLQFVGGFRGWGRGVRRAVAAWYTDRPERDLAHQLLKYPQRDGWSHRDALRLAHPVPRSDEQRALFRRTVAGGTIEGPPSDALAQVRAVDALLAGAEIDPARAAALVREARLTREMVPTPLLRHAQVWEALLEEMPLTALVRNLATLTRVGVLAPGSDASAAVAARLADGEALRRARVHPVQVLSALRTYASGRGVRGKGTWTPVAQVVDALDAAFYLAFAGVEPSRRRMMLALDVSGSMAANVHGLEGLSCREASAAMALVTAATEPRHFFTAFTAGKYRSMHRGFSSGLTPLSISPRQRLDDVVRQVESLPFGGTDCALPMLEAMNNGWMVDLFVVYTDNETWAGDVHPAQALRRYRERTGIPAKLVVVGMASNGFSVADPEDAGMLDVVGFDAAAPQLIADFAR
ncbi:MAG: Prophage Clp protease-like protein [uncultured Gemmatimonadetes bacterium]|uniref:Prophage Clp protease-like protein n=1 Tax=uncultured Gemmatimonadota bacterium TaxID=203437 RepID=A0A6J4MG19_9BACT|nr:MAG: Prophage Clp protease-like protein [uncultured Gemmatimonadota bacterium]